MSNYNPEDEIPDLFDIAGSEYYFDLEELSKFIRIEKSNSIDTILGGSDDNKPTEDESNDVVDMGMDYTQIIDITKWETTKVMIETLLSEQGPIDEAMGVSKLSGQLSIPFKLSFNTLLKYKIIKENHGR